MLFRTRWDSGPDGAANGVGPVVTASSPREALQYVEAINPQPDEGWGVPGIYWHAEPCESVRVRRTTMACPMCGAPESFYEWEATPPEAAHARKAQWSECPHCFAPVDCEVRVVGGA